LETNSDFVHVRVTPAPAGSRLSGTRDLRQSDVRRRDDRRGGEQASSPCRKMRRHV